MKYAFSFAAMSASEAVNILVKQIYFLRVSNELAQTIGTNRFLYTIT
jgi:hypothetical protein